MRKRGRVDGSQAELVKDLRKVGCSVWITSNMGSGGPDLVVGYHGMNWLLEVKDPKQPLSKRKLTHDEAEFFAGWNGQISIVHNFAEAYALIADPPAVQMERVEVGNEPF